MYNALMVDRSICFLIVGLVQGGIPGAENLRECKVLEGILKKHAAEGRVYSAICASPAAVLGPLGLLDGLKVRFFWS